MVCPSCFGPNPPRYWGESKFCSNKCRWVSQPRVMLSCWTCGRVRRIKMSQLGRSHFCSKFCHGRYYAGERSPNWKGGVSRQERTLDGDTSYYLWRRAVLERDGYACVLCGATPEDGIKLEVDHILPWVHFPERRGDVDNGRTLCSPCHKATDTYGTKARMASREMYAVPDDLR